MFLIDTMFRLF